MERYYIDVPSFVFHGWSRWQPDWKHWAAGFNVRMGADIDVFAGAAVQEESERGFHFSDSISHRVRFLDVPWKHHGESAPVTYLDHQIWLTLDSLIREHGLDEAIRVYLASGEGQLPELVGAPSRWGGRTLRVPVDFIRISRIVSSWQHRYESVVATIEVGHHLVLWEVEVMPAGQRPTPKPGLAPDGPIRGGLRDLIERLYLKDPAAVQAIAERHEYGGRDPRDRTFTYAAPGVDPKSTPPALEFLQPVAAG